MNTHLPESPKPKRDLVDSLLWLLVPLALVGPVLIVWLGLVLAGWRPAPLVRLSTMLPAALVGATPTALARSAGPQITAHPTARGQIGLTPAKPDLTPTDTAQSQPATAIAPAYTATPGPPAIQPTRQAESTVYVVQPGDTINKVASELGVPAQYLIEGNEIFLAPGQVLHVPHPSAPASTPSPPAATAPTGSVFRYVFPIQPPSVAGYQAGHHDYPATDIFAPAGSTVVAVTPGVVQEMSREDQWDPQVNDGATRGGLFVSLIGDDGVRYYFSHLSAVVPWLEPGMRVAAGELLAYVGNTGNARGVPPHLHFGISHPTFVGDWQVRRGEVWPFEYLQAWERGEMVTPKLPAR